MSEPSRLRKLAGASPPAPPPGSTALPPGPARGPAIQY